jgi:hypothetical protein
MEFAIPLDQLPFNEPLPIHNPLSPQQQTLYLKKTQGQAANIVAHTAGHPTTLQFMGPHTVLLGLANSFYIYHKKQED